MSKFRKVILSITLISSLSLNTVLASPIDDQLNNQKAQLQQQTDQLKNAQDKTKDLELNIEKLDSSIQKTMDEINSNKKQISNTEKDISLADKQLQDAQNKLDEEIKLYGQRVRAMYINRNNDFLETIVSAKGFSEFIDTINIFKKMSELDDKITSEISQYQIEVNSKKETLNKKKQAFVSLKAENEKKMAKMLEDKNQQSKLVDEARKQEKLYASKVDASKTLVNQTLKQIEAIKSSVPKYDPNRGSAPISDNAIVVFASRFLGTQYVWGGTTPVPGFDCSGFMQYIYNHFGIGISRTTYTQIHEGVEVARGQLQPGDLVFFGSFSDPHHVGMYVGNGTYIHAPRTGDVIKLSALDGRGDYVTARRIK